MRPEELTGKKILYGCLDWGNGHIARSVPLILQLQSQGNHVFFMGSPEQQTVLSRYGFTGTFKELPPTGFRFKGDGNFVLEALRNVRIVSKAVRRDQERVSDYAQAHGIDLILSDHRYGVRCDTIPSVFITHQVELPPKTNPVARWIHRKWMARFNSIWIMDDEQNRLAGTLSRFVPGSCYIGHYSRFSLTNSTTESGKVVAVISGPEPYAEQFFNEMVKAANTSQQKWTIVCSANYAAAAGLKKGTILVNNWKRADEAIASAEYVVSRNGYTTLMDLTVLQKKAILIPTPGQLEQQYLAVLHREHSLWKMVPEHSLMQHLDGIENAN